MKEITPRTPAEALRYARTWERAQNLIAQGYGFWQTEGAAPTDAVAVLKPGETSPAYWLNEAFSGLDTCTCPDFEKHGDYCKHLIAWDEVCRDAARCAEYEAMMQDAECASGCDYIEY